MSFFQAPGSSVGLLNGQGIFNVTITGGSEAPSFGGVNASIDLVLNFQSTTNVQSLLGTTKSIRSRLSSGEVLASPEPATLTLIGTGLLGMLVRCVGVLGRQDSSASREFGARRDPVRSGLLLLKE
jgi:hypothetical protein